MKLEDVMVRRIQRMIRRVYGKRFDHIVAVHRYNMATKIQSMYRSAVKRRDYIRNFQGTQLALLLQRMKRMQGAGGVLNGLRRAKYERDSLALIQRAWRGKLGRERVKSKKFFLSEIAKCNNIVSVENFTPGMLEDLADSIDFFIKDFSRNLPVELLSLFRAVMYMFNGDKAVKVTIEDQGHFIEREFYAKDLAWNGMLLILRRKGRFLRRIRAYGRQVKLPNAKPLRLTDSAKKHVVAVCKSINEDTFKNLELGFKGVSIMVQYVKALKEIYDIQVRPVSLLRPLSCPPHPLY
jgi:hypothetical protein